MPNYQEVIDSFNNLLSHEKIFLDDKFGAYILSEYTDETKLWIFNGFREFLGGFRKMDYSLSWYIPQNCQASIRNILSVSQWYSKPEIEFYLDKLCLWIQWNLNEDFEYVSKPVLQQHNREVIRKDFEILFYLIKSFLKFDYQSTLLSIDNQDKMVTIAEKINKCINVLSFLKGVNPDGEKYLGNGDYNLLIEDVKQFITDRKYVPQKAIKFNLGNSELRRTFWIVSNIIYGIHKVEEMFVFMVHIVSNFKSSKEVVLNGEWKANILYKKFSGNKRTYGIYNPAYKKYHEPELTEI